MITSLHLTNFKAFEHLDLTLRPISILSGANSSGKSSILQALLLLRQTFESRTDLQLLLNGDLVKLGGYQDITFGKDQKRNIILSIGREWRGLPVSLTDKVLGQFFSKQEVEEIGAKLERYNNRRARRLGETKIGTSALSTTYEFRFSVDETSKDPLANSLESIAAITQLIGRPSRQAKLTVKRQERRFTGTATVPAPTGLDTEHVIQDVNWYRMMPEAISLSPRRRRLENEILSLFDFPNLLLDTTANIHYIGPLRTEPQRVYMMSGDNFDSDLHGDHTTQALLRDSLQPVNFLLDDLQTVQPMPLLDAVNVTLKRLDIQQAVSTTRLHEIVGQLHFDLIGHAGKVTIVDVGFGLSQILPIIVAGISAKAGDLLLIEQPETHLHPKVQERLAEFFLMLNKLGKRVIVETHSDHILNGFRMHIASDMTDALKEMISVAFVRPPTSSNPSSRVDLLEFDEYGMIENWPPEFMSETMKQMQQIFRLGAKKKQLRRVSS